MTHLSFIGTLLFTCSVCLDSASVLGALSVGDIYRQWKEREELVNIITSPLKEHNLATNLSKEEIILDRYLSFLRQKEIEKDLFSSPIEDTLDDILKSDLFQVLRSLPKGGNMHIHENHILSRRLLLDLIWQCEDFPHLHILPADHPSRPLEMDFFLVPPGDEPWLKVKDSRFYTKEYLVRNLNHVDILRGKADKPSSFNTRRRWRDSNHLWKTFTNVVANVKVKVKYIEAIIRTSLEDGVQYLESKKSFGKKEMLYELNDDPKYSVTYGKRFLEEVSGMTEIPMVKGVIDSFLAGARTSGDVSLGNSGVRFSGMKRLVQSVRNYPKDRVHEDAVRSIMLHKAFPDHIAGLDLAGEEDIGHSNFYFSDTMQLLAEYGRETNNSFRFVSHAGESSDNGEVRFRPRVDTHRWSHDNVLDAILFNSSRIGHALSMITSPELMRLVKERDIAIEVCPVVNHIMGNIPDIRNHPAITYYHSGLPIVLGSDSHGIFGFEYFTVVWYTVYVAWDLGIGDLKQLAYQSLVYSSMNDSERKTAITDWGVAWDYYVTSLVSTVCADDTADETHHFDVFHSPYIPLRVIPTQIPHWALGQNDTVDIHIYDNSFSWGICEDLFCKTDQGIPSLMSYVTSEHFICRLRPLEILKATQTQRNQTSFNIFVAVGGNDFIKVNQTIFVLED